MIGLEPCASMQGRDLAITRWTTADLDNRQPHRYIDLGCCEPDATRCRQRFLHVIHQFKQQQETQQWPGGKSALLGCNFHFQLQRHFAVICCLHRFCRQPGQLHRSCAAISSQQGRDRISAGIGQCL